MVCWQYFLSSCPSLFPAEEKAGGEGKEKEETVKKKVLQNILNLKLPRFLKTCVHTPAYSNATSKTLYKSKCHKMKVIFSNSSNGYYFLFFLKEVNSLFMCENCRTALQISY